jgi:hypothetical protein
MVRLDTEERTAKQHPVEAVSPERARHYLERLSQLWAETEAEGRVSASQSRFGAGGLNVRPRTSRKWNAARA